MPRTNDDDRADVARQIGREPRAFRSVAVRCPFGRPAVTEQSPYDPLGEPFPTTYYVTCRHLVAAISRPVATSQNRTVPSLPHETSVRLSGENSA